MLFNCSSDFFARLSAKNETGKCTDVPTEDLGTWWAGLLEGQLGLVVDRILGNHGRAGRTGFVR
jgi:hypothetical protein